MHTSMHTCIYAYIYIHVLEIHRYIGTKKMQGCKNTKMQGYVDIWMPACISTYLHTYTPARLHTIVNIYIYIYIPQFISEDSKRQSFRTHPTRPGRYRPRIGRENSRWYQVFIPPIFHCKFRDLLLQSVNLNQSIDIVVWIYIVSSSCLKIAVDIALSILIWLRTVFDWGLVHGSNLTTTSSCRLMGNRPNKQ